MAMASNLIAMASNIKGPEVMNWEQRVIDDIVAEPSSKLVKIVSTLVRRALY